MAHDLAGERVDYSGARLVESDAPADPLQLFGRWLDDAFAARDHGLLTEPTAMVLATCEAGQPHARTVLLKELDHSGFVFFTNYTSAKGHQLAANPLVAAHFGWYAIYRQIRIEGVVEQVLRSESEDYFASRPRGSQLGAWASAQSAEVASPDELVEAYAAAEQRFGDRPIPCPPDWGGYRVVPELIEFWQGRPNRMHDRLRYHREDGDWRLVRLAP